MVKQLLFFCYIFFLIFASSCTARKTNSGIHDSTLRQLSFEIENSYNSYSSTSETHADLKIEIEREKETEEYRRSESKSFKKNFKKFQSEKVNSLLKLKLKRKASDWDPFSYFKKNKNVVWVIGNILFDIGVLILLLCLIIFLTISISHINPIILLCGGLIGLGFVIMSLPFLAIGALLEL